MAGSTTHVGGKAKGKERVLPARTRLQADARALQILAAAERALRRYGAAKVTIDDIAKLSGIDRRSVYRAFESKRAVFEAVLLSRLRLIAAAVARRVEASLEIEEAIVEGSLETLRLARADTLLEELAFHDATLTLDVRRIEPQAERGELFDSIWGGVFYRAEKEGRLRPMVSRALAEEWLMAIHHMLNLRRDLEEDDIRALLQSFILPSVLKDR